MVYTVGFDTSALDTEFKAHAFRGIGRYVYELKRYFDNNLPRSVRIESFQHSEFQNGGVLGRLIDLLPAGRQTMKQQLLYPLSLGAHLKKRFDLIHFPAHMDAPSWSLRNYVITVLDLIPLVLKDLYKANKPGWGFTFARWLEIRAIKNASLILAISENTARDVNRILGVPEDRIVVTHLGVDNRFSERPLNIDLAALRQTFSLPTGRRLILYTGGIDPRKNYPVLVRTMNVLREMYRERSAEAPYLALIGEIHTDREYPRLLELIKRFDLTDDIGILGFVPDDGLRELYAIADLFFFPSLYEGFGLPPLEAMAAGVPVVSSDRSCMPEILADAAMLINPEDEKQAAKALDEVLNNPGLADELRDRGRRRAALFPWSNTAEKTLRAYEQVATRLAASPGKPLHAER